MTREYKATPEQWAHQETWLDQNDADAACLLELRSRVKALEEAEKDRVFAASVEALDEAENDRRFEAAKVLIDRPAPVPAGSLVDRVRKALNYPPDPYAHAAIRFIAGELRAQCFVQAADWLDQGANSTSQENLDG
jgi:hypothetical protein